jgi:hypothetical protein
VVSPRAPGFDPGLRRFGVITQIVGEGSDDPATFGRIRQEIESIPSFFNVYIKVWWLACACIWQKRVRGRT